MMDQSIPIGWLVVDPWSMDIHWPMTPSIHPSMRYLVLVSDTYQGRSAVSYRVSYDDPKFKIKTIHHHINTTRDRRDVIT